MDISKDIQNKILASAGHGSAEEEKMCEISLDEIDSFGNKESIMESYQAIKSFCYG